MLELPVFKPFLLYTIKYQDWRNEWCTLKKRIIDIKKTQSYHDSTLSKLSKIDSDFWALLPKEYEKPNCLTSVQLALKKNLVMYFKLKHRLIKTNFVSDFECASDIHSTRSWSRHDLKIKKCKLQAKRIEFVNITTKLYNLMDPVKRSSKLLTVFEKEATRMVISHFSN